MVAVRLHKFQLFRTFPPSRLETISRLREALFEIICITSVLHLCYICVTSVLHLCYICVASVLHLCCICVASVLHLCCICRRQCYGGTRRYTAQGATPSRFRRRGCTRPRAARTAWCGCGAPKTAPSRRSSNPRTRNRPPASTVWRSLRRRAS